MALAKETRLRAILIDFPTLDGYTLRCKEALDLVEDGVILQELSVSEPYVLQQPGTEVPAALATVFGEIAAEVIAGSHQAAVEHEARLQEVADQRARADNAERLATEQAQRADEAEHLVSELREQLLNLQQRNEAAEGKLAAVVQAVSPAEAASLVPE